MSAFSSDKHPHEPEIPPALDEEGRCLVCGLAVQLGEAERVLRVISGWNVDLVSTADAIQPAVAYFAAKAVPRG